MRITKESDRVIVVCDFKEFGIKNKPCNCLQGLFQIVLSHEDSNLDRQNQKL